MKSVEGGIGIAFLILLMVAMMYGRFMYIKGVADFKKKKFNPIDKNFERFVVWALQVKGLPTEKRKPRQRKPRRRQSRRKSQPRKSSPPSRPVSPYDPEWDLDKHQ